MPSLYSTGTNTTYTVTASNVITLYQVSTSTAVITATTYSTNLVGLYGGSYSALPTNAAQLINLFDNNGNVHFYLDPVTNSSTIYANFVGTASIILGNYSFNNNTITNIVNAGIDLATNGKHYILGSTGNITLPGGGTIGDTYGDGLGNVNIQPGYAGGYAGLNSYDQQQYVDLDNNNVQIGTGYPGATKTWTFNKDGSTNFPNYLFPYAHGLAGQVLTDNGGGILAWTTITSASTATTVNSITAGTGISVSTSTGSVVISNTGVLSLTAGTGTFISTSTGNITIWTAISTATTVSTAFDFGTILAPVSYTLDMGPIIV